jgi:hypothetical protein
MGGKASILIVMGFSAVLLVMTQNFNSLTVRSVDNFASYYEETIAHNIAVSGANFAASALFFDNHWTSGFSDVQFGGGKFDVTVIDTSAVQNEKIITVVSTYPWPASPAPGYSRLTDTVMVKLQPSRFSKFAYYSAFEPSNIWWTDGDTVHGPMHVQGTLRVNGAPVFHGKVTTETGIDSAGGYWDYRESGGHWERQWKWGRWQWVWVIDYNRVWIPAANPQFLGGYEDGVDLDMPANGVSDVRTLAQSGGHVFSGHDTVYITFDEDSIKYKYGKYAAETAVLGTNLAANGVIFADDAVVRAQGTVDGLYTLGVSGSSSKGKLFIDDDIVYYDNPNTNPNSTDMLGMVVENEVLITNNSANNTDVNIHGSIYIQDGGFGAEDYDTRPNSGTINLLGGIQQATRRAVGTFNSGGIVSGFNKNYRYDNRFLISSPPGFPGTGKFEIVSWFE